MPFTEEGIHPDIIMNPHAIPSRMTISQLIECMASKVGGLEGKFVDGTPFNNYNVRELPKILEKLGYEKYGTETMYCGITGKKMDAKIFIGPTYYIRLKHMVQDKVHCLTMDHEVLTNNGWKYFKDISKKDEICCLDNDKIVYEKPLELLHYPDYKGKMYHISNQQIDLTVTNNHRMYVSKPYGRKQVWLDYDFIEAEKIYGKHCKYKKNGIWDKKDYQFILDESTDGNNIVRERKEPDMDSWLTFFGIWMAEGWCDTNLNNSHRNHYQLSISINKKRVKRELFPALEKLGYNYNITKDEKCRINDFQLYNYMKRLSVGAVNKFLPNWVWKLSQQQSVKLVESMILGDGCYKEFSVVYYTSSVKLADDFMRLCLHAGWACNKSLHHHKGNETIMKDGRVIKATKDHWRLAVIKDRCNPSVNHSHVKKQNIQKEELFDYKGEVFCLQVPSEVFYVRKNGKPVWTGNSRSSGPIQALTRQPLEGRARDGGLKIGEMEKDAMVAHGCGQFLKERMMETSDITMMHVCDECGMFAQKAIDKDYYVCPMPKCRNSRISEVVMPYACKLLFQELMAVNILPKIETERSIYGDNI